jgi:thymidine kinase
MNNETYLYIFINRQMNINQSFAGIDIIIGPMFSGKTTELCRRLNILQTLGLRCLYINSDIDNRSIKNFSTHNKMLNKISFDSHKIKDIHLLKQIGMNYDVIGIDEIQFFKNIVNVIVDLVETHGKKIIVSGLNGDSNRNLFGEIHLLLPYSNNIDKIDSYCVKCYRQGIQRHGIFSQKEIQNNEIVTIGGSDKYISVCRECYLK